MTRFDFRNPAAKQALVMVSYHLDFLLDYLDQPALLALPMSEQMQLITDQLAKTETMGKDHALCTLSLCLIRLLEARHPSPGPSYPERES